MKYPFNNKAETTFGWFNLTEEKSVELIKKVFELMKQDKKRVGDMMNEVMTTVPETYEEMLFCVFLLGVDNGKNFVMHEINEKAGEAIKEMEHKMNEDKLKGMGSTGDYMSSHRKKIIN